MNLVDAMVQKRNDLFALRIKEFFDAINEGSSDHPIIGAFKDHMYGTIKDKLTVEKVAEPLIGGPPPTNAVSDMLCLCLNFGNQLRRDAKLYAFASLYKEKRFASPEAARIAFQSIGNANEQNRIASKMPGFRSLPDFFKQLEKDPVGTGLSMEACNEFLARLFEMIPTIQFKN
jgi:hypothetical protein